MSAPRTLTDTDKREIRDVEDLIATLTSYAALSDAIFGAGEDRCADIVIPALEMEQAA